MIHEVGWLVGWLVSLLVGRGREELKLRTRFTGCKGEGKFVSVSD
jgi:hypothetical protein